MPSLAPPVAVVPPIARVDDEDRLIYRRIKKDLRAYWKDPYNKVLNEPVRAVIYSVAIKAVALFVAIIFTSIGYTIFGLSIGVIDRIAYQNASLFFHRIINCWKEVIGSRIVSAGDWFFEIIDGSIDRIPSYNEQPSDSSEFSSAAELEETSNSYELYESESSDAPELEETSNPEELYESESSDSEDSSSD